MSMHGNREIEIIEGLAKESRLDMAGLAVLLTTENAETVKYLQTQARAAADKIYGKEIYIRGLIEFTAADSGLPLHQSTPDSFPCFFRQWKV